MRKNRKPAPPPPPKVEPKPKPLVTRINAVLVTCRGERTAEFDGGQLTDLSLAVLPEMLRVSWKEKNEKSGELETVTRVFWSTALEDVEFTTQQVPADV